MESAFGVRLHRLQDAHGRLFRAPDGEPMVPASLAPLLTGVAGLDTSAVRRPHFRRMAADSPALGALPLETGSGPGGGLTPSDIKTAYNLKGVPLTGAGQTLAVFELDGYSSSDISAYESAYGLPSVTLQNVAVDGGSGALNASGGQPEVTLDIELEIALAPGASKITGLRRPQQRPGPARHLQPDRHGQPRQTGQHVLGTGRAGHRLLLRPDWRPPSFSRWRRRGSPSSPPPATAARLRQRARALCVDDPASQPYVTGVGGTSLTTSGKGGPYGHESVWNDGPGDAGGGGISAFWAIPATGSRASLLGGLPGGSADEAAMRNVPDVSLDADPNTGYSIYVRAGLGALRRHQLRRPALDRLHGPGQPAAVRQRRRRAGLRQPRPLCRRPGAVRRRATSTTSRAATICTIPPWPATTTRPAGAP